MAIAIGGIVSSGLMVLTVMYTSKRYNGYGYCEQIMDVLPVVGACVCMGVSVYFIGMLPLTDLPMLVLQVVVGGIVYIGVGWFFKISGFIILENYLFAIFYQCNIKK